MKERYINFRTGDTRRLIEKIVSEQKEPTLWELIRDLIRRLF